MSDDINERIEILNQSVMNSWTGIFPLKENDKMNLDINSRKNLIKEIKVESERLNKIPVDVLISKINDNCGFKIHNPKNWYSKAPLKDLNKVAKFLKEYA